MPYIKFSNRGRFTADTILAFEEPNVFPGALPLQNLLINTEFSRRIMIDKDGVNIFLRNSKSGGLFILRRFDSLPLFFLRGEGVCQAYTSSLNTTSSADALMLFIRPTHFI